MSGKNVLVTGGTGFLGKNLVPRLAASSGSVTVASLGEDDPFAGSENVRLLAGDLSDRDFCRQALDGIDACFHLASFKRNFRYHLEHPIEVFSKNVALSEAFFSMAAESGLKALVLPSSVALYAPKDGFLEESDPINPETKDAYASAKIVAEAAARVLASARPDISISIARCDNFFGPGDDFGPDAQVIPSLIRKAVEDGEIAVWGSGNQERTFAYVDDVCDALMAMAGSGEGLHVLNVSQGEAASFEEIIGMIQGILKSEKKVVFDTGKPEGAKRRLVSAERIKRELSWKPKFDLEEGLRKTIRYYLKSR